MLTGTQVGPDVCLNQNAYIHCMYLEHIGAVLSTNNNTLCIYIVSGAYELLIVCMYLEHIGAVLSTINNVLSGITCI